MALILATFLFPAESLAQTAAQAATVQAVQNQPSRTVLPTDVVPLPLAEERRVLGDTFKFRLFQKLPLRFYLNSTVETSGRYETNVFQFPTKRTILNKATYDRNETFGALSTENQSSLLSAASRSSQSDNVFRVTPNITAGWALTKRTNVFVNYFYFRDKLARFNSLNTYINQVAAGIEHQIPIGRKLNLELQYQNRELWQDNARAVFDYMPSTTLTAYLRPNLIAYVNALGQFRSLHPFGAVKREIDPFFTIGAVHQRGRWSYSANMTYLNTFRHGFGDASLNLNSQTIICDFEIARQISKKFTGLQTFVRAEPVYNFKTNNTPGLAGMDFRIFYGLRASVSKPVIYTGFDIKKRYKQMQKLEEEKQKKEKEQQEKLKNGTPGQVTPGTPEPNGTPGTPTAPPFTPDDDKKQKEEKDTSEAPNSDLQSIPTANSLDTDQVILDAAAPMHGFITESGKEVEDATLVSEVNPDKGHQLTY